NRLPRAEVGGELDHAAACGTEVLGRPHEDRYVGPTEAVDRLLGVADDEEMPGGDVQVVPLGGPRLGPVRFGRRDTGSQLYLYGVGVLELVEQQPVVAVVQGGAHRRPVDGVAQEGPGQDEKIVELQLTRA